MYEIKARSFFGCLTLFLVLLSGSCAKQVTDKQSLNINQKDYVCVLPLENNTETPLAGRRVASILEGVLITKGYKVENRLLNLDSRDYTRKEIFQLMKRLREKGVKYAFTGAVNEFRYKVGVDGEPAVSIILYLYELSKDRNRLIWSSTGSASGWSYESLGTVTQKLINRLIKRE